jgi:predicted metal-dependent hydrolase
MSAPPLIVRRLLIDLHQPFDRHWNGGDAFRSAWFNALSMSFPLGEQFFIDSVRAGLTLLPEAERERFAPELQGFIGQEATHRRMHALFNGHLAQQGHVNAWQARIERRLERLQGAHPLHAVGITAATEHFTAILAEHLLAHPQLLDGAEPRLRTLWLWHAAEEAEHRSTAFDLYRAMGGNERWRRRWFLLVSWHFFSDVLRQTARNVAHDGVLWRVSTWRSAARFFFGRGGLLRHTFGPWRAYWSSRFHPRQQGGELGVQWLKGNTEQYAALG